MSELSDFTEKRAIDLCRKIVKIMENAPSDLRMTKDDDFMWMEAKNNLMGIVRQYMIFQSSHKKYTSDHAYFLASLEIYYPLLAAVIFDHWKRGEKSSIDDRVNISAHKRSQFEKLNNIMKEEA